jgi:3',5'-cyclic AMP phosphodiesterase CpdA
MLRAARELVWGLEAAGVDHVVATGDITDTGRAHELAQFHEVFAPLIAQGRLTVVPGNHDRLGDDPGAAFMDGQRVDTVELDGAYLVRVDSTGPQNRASSVSSHGSLCERVLDQISEALERAPAGALTAILMHHHPVVLPPDGILERISNSFGFPFALELALGEEMLRRVLGRCDLVLHGHRHVPSAHVLDPQGLRPLRVYNAGCSVARRGANVFTHAAGALVAEPRWLSVGNNSEPTAILPPYQTTEYRLAI